MSIKLHVFPPSPRAFKVLLAAHYFGIDYELRLVDLTKSEQSTPQFAALNPNKRMPVLEEDGFVLWESNAIVEYLASKAGDALPREPRERLALTKWLYWDSNHWDPACAIFVFERIVKPFFALGETSESEIVRGTALFSRLGGVLNGELGKHRFVTGEKLSLADLAIGSSLCVAERVNYPLEDFRAIQRWHTELKALPAWQRACALQGG